MCLKELCFFTRPAVEGDLGPSGRHPEMQQKHHLDLGAPSKPNLPKPSDPPKKKPTEDTEDYGKVDSSDRLPKIEDGGQKWHPPPKTITSNEVHQRSPFETNNGSRESFVNPRTETELPAAITSPKESVVSKQLPAKITDNNEPAPSTKITKKDHIAAKGDFTAKGQTKTTNFYGGSYETVETKDAEGRTKTTNFYGGSDETVEMKDEIKKHQF